jgi:hypothetical protein
MGDTRRGAIVDGASAEPVFCDSGGNAKRIRDSSRCEERSDDAIQVVEGLREWPWIDSQRSQ